jgi:CheY-like chemotaxis protein
LRDLGHDVKSATNAREALVILRRDTKIDVRFSDVVMPGGMNGVELAIEARRIRPGLKVLLTSAIPPPHRRRITGYQIAWKCCESLTAGKIWRKNWPFNRWVTLQATRGCAD